MESYQKYFNHKTEANVIITCTTCSPLITCPKMISFSLRSGIGAVVMKISNPLFLGFPLGVPTKKASCFKLIAHKNYNYQIQMKLKNCKISTINDELRHQPCIRLTMMLSSQNPIFCDPKILAIAHLNRIVFYHMVKQHSTKTILLTENPMFQRRMFNSMGSCNII